MSKSPVGESAAVALAVLSLLVVTTLPFVVPFVGDDVATPPDDAGYEGGTGRATLERSSTSPDGTPVGGVSREPISTATDGSRADASGGPDREYCRSGKAGTKVAGLDSLERLDAEDPTGANVTVAILDPTGFDVDDPRIRDSVQATASFAAQGESSVGNGGFDRHGTASAALVTQVAPDAELLLTNFRTAADFRRGVDWALERSADVIVAPAVFYAKPDDGSTPVSRAVSDAANAGVPVVVPTGNVAERHWSGTHDGGKWVEFADGRTRLQLEGSNERVRLWLWWNGSTSQDRHDVTIHLYEETENGSRHVARSRAYPRGPVEPNQVLVESVETNDLLSQPVSNGSYYVRVSAPSNATHYLELVSTTHRFADPVSRRSIAAPATARASGVVAVGAAKPTERRPMDRSGRGPTNDGRQGIDILAPGAAPEGSSLSFSGTSAAAAYTGGVVALLHEVDPGITPGETERVLETSAAPVPNFGRLATGHGLLDADDAIACARNATDR